MAGTHLKIVGNNIHAFMWNVVSLTFNVLFNTTTLNVTIIVPLYTNKHREYLLHLLENTIMEI